jgi:hypothetical protein
MKCFQKRTSNDPLAAMREFLPTARISRPKRAELMAAGCAKVFKEKVSGAKTDRAELPS